MSAWSIDTLLRTMDLAIPSQTKSDLVMLIDNGGTPVSGDSTRRFPDGKPRLDMKGWTWGQIIHAVGGAADGSRNYTPLTVVRSADAASGSLSSLCNNRVNRLTVSISQYRVGGDAAVTDTQPMFEIQMTEAQIVGQYFLSGTHDVLNEILVFSYRGITIRTASQQRTGIRGGVRECQIVVGNNT